MSSHPSSSTHFAAAAMSAAPKLEPVRTCAAFGNPLRWKIMKMMSDGSTLTAGDASMVLRRDVDTVMKHLRLLRNLGLVEVKTSSQDARYLLYYIPERWRTQPGVLQYGSCTFRMDQTRT